MTKVLVTGGAGYIGSHILRRLAEDGCSAVALDDLSTGHRQAVGRLPLVEGDFGDPALLDRLLGDGGTDYVIHMAAFCEVGESMQDPAGYYRNNLTRGLALLDAARRHDVKGIVFSSSAAVYGEPVAQPMEEDHPKLPTNPYGETKLAFERALGWYRQAYGLDFVALRYFNAAGAHPDGSMGEDHARESHLIPRLLLALLHDGDPIPIFGTDYPTKDGTCVRDYVHVGDLAQAHVRALEAMRAGEAGGEAFNLGNGEGFSVLEVIETVREVCGQPPPTVPAPRRAGDPASLVASSKRAVARLGWRPERASLREIVRTAWAWHSAHPRGYAERA
jgi:UDP-glucose 4-epimerase